jgi:hypothetical protein
MINIENLNFFLLFLKKLSEIWRYYFSNMFKREKKIKII